MPRFVELNGGQDMVEIHRKAPRHCHKMVRDVAKGIAAAAWEIFASDNNFYKIWPKQRDYARLKWGLFVDDARENMGKLLGDSSVPETEKVRIYEALQMDAAAKGGNVQAVTH